ncbi:MAG: DNA cytosine methyltransferase [Aureispira sp.]
MNTVDLFSGCGGLSLGFQNEDFEILAAFDKWKPAISIYEDNFNHPIYDTDLASEAALEMITSLSPEIIIGGPPCQDFSSAGKRDESLGRADLTISFAKIIASTKPKWFVMENVSRIKKSNILSQAIQIFQDSNYGLTQEILDASLCGVPQKRKRFFLIGRLNGKAGELDYYLSKNQDKTPMTLYDYFGNDLGLEHYYRHPRSYQRRGIFSIHEPSPTIRGVNRPMPKNYKKHSGDTCSPSSEVRALTTRERGSIQTFPKSFKFQGTKTNLEQAIGNAVPVKLGSFIAKAIKEFEQDLHNNQVKNISKNGQLILKID